MDASLRELLALNRSLQPTDRRLLEALMLHPAAAPARQLARLARTNVQSVYVALDRLEARGLVLRERRSSGMVFRAAHPTAVIHELLADGRRATALAERVELPLRRLHESESERSSSPDDSRAFVTGSLTACLGTLLTQLRTVRSEVWLAGSESPWCSASTAVEQELAKLQQRLPPGSVRALVPPPVDDPARESDLTRLARVGVAIRYTRLFTTPMLVLDRRWMFFRASSEPNGATAPRNAYVRLDAPDLAVDLVAGFLDSWAKGPEPPRSAARVRPARTGAHPDGLPNRIGAPLPAS